MNWVFTSERGNIVFPQEEGTRDTQKERVVVDKMYVETPTCLHTNFKNQLIPRNSISTVVHSTQNCTGGTVRYCDNDTRVFIKVFLVYDIPYTESWMTKHHLSRKGMENKKDRFLRDTVSVNKNKSTRSY